MGDELEDEIMDDGLLPFTDELLQSREEHSTGIPRKMDDKNNYFYNNYN